MCSFGDFRFNATDDCRLTFLYLYSALLISCFFIKATNANDDPEEEERLKHETMNGRLAKKIRHDMLAGKDFCDNLAIVLQGVLVDLDRTIASEEATKKAAASSTKSKDAESKKHAKETKAKTKAESEGSTKQAATTQPKVPDNPNAETVAEGTAFVDASIGPWTLPFAPKCFIGSHASFLFFYVSALMYLLVQVTRKVLLYESFESDQRIRFKRFPFRKKTRH